MTCEQAMALMSAGLDGELHSEEAEALKAHLEGCPACRALWDAMQTLDQKVAALREPAPEGLKKGVLYRIDQATGKAKKPARRWFGPGTAIGAVAAVLVLLVGIGVIPLGGRATQAAAPMDQDIAAPKTQAPYYYEDKSENAPAADGMLTGGEFLAPSATKQVSNYGMTNMDAEPCEDGVPVDTESRSGGIPMLGGESDAAERELAGCAALSENEDALVLLYTEFTPESLFGLLKVQAPALYRRVEALTPVSEYSLLVYEADCDTVLAIQEWLLAHAPQTGEQATKEEAAVTEQMEALDPDSGSLFRVITRTAAAGPVDWPESWSEDWALRLRSAENWSLFYPREDYVAASDAPAFLVFSLPER